ICSSSDAARLIPPLSQRKPFAFMSRSSAPMPEGLRERCAAISREESVLREGGGKAGQDRQHKMGRLFARERISRLLDPSAPFFEIQLWAAHKMYDKWGQLPAAGAVVGLGHIAGVPCMVIANVSTVK